MNWYEGITHRVTFEETNLVGNVYFSHYLRWQGHCREQFLMDHCPTVVSRLSGELVLFTLSCSCRYLDELRAMDRVQVRMRLKEPLHGHRISLEFEYRRLEEDGRARRVAVGQQEISVMTRRDGPASPIVLPPELREALRPFE